MKSLGLIKTINPSTIKKPALGRKANTQNPVIDDGTQYLTLALPYPTLPIISPRLAPMCPDPHNPTALRAKAEAEAVAGTVTKTQVQMKDLE